MYRTIVWGLSGILLVLPSYGAALATVESRTGVPIVRPSIISAAASNGTTATEERTARLTLKQIEDLKQEISELRGLVEVQDHEIQQLKKSQQEFYLDLDKRLKQVRIEDSNDKQKNNVSAAGKVPAISKAPAVTPVTVPTEATDNEYVPVAPAVVAETEKESFGSAYTLVRTKRYAEAVRAFKEYLTKFPTGQHAPNAHYWLGEVYMSQWQATHKTKKELLEKANQEFLNITSQFPTHQKVTDALLKLGLIEHEKGDLEAARQYLTEVKDRYPGSAAARIAETRLEQLH
jgi:tol-pal system protein YbgF